MTAATLASSLQPSTKTMSFPRMGRSLELAVPGTTDAKVWWIDPNVMVVWSAKPLPVGEPIVATIDLVGGGAATVTMVVPAGQPPMRAENGSVSLARYTAKDAAAARALSTALIRINPRAFKADYVPPRLPKSVPVVAQAKAGLPALGSRERVMLAVAGGVAVLGALSFLLV